MREDPGTVAGVPRDDPTPGHRASTDPVITGCLNTARTSFQATRTRAVDAPAVDISGAVPRDTAGRHIHAAVPAPRARIPVTNVTDSVDAAIDGGGPGDLLPPAHRSTPDRHLCDQLRAPTRALGPRSIGARSRTRPNTPPRHGLPVRTLAHAAEAPVATHAAGGPRARAAGGGHFVHWGKNPAVAAYRVHNQGPVLARWAKAQVV